MFNLTLQTDYLKAQNKEWHGVLIKNNGNIVCHHFMQMSDIEDLELQLTNIVKQLYDYRKQQEQE